MKLIKRLHDYFIPESQREDVEEYRKSRILVNTSLLTVVFALFFLINTIMFQMPKTFWCMFACIIFFGLIPFLFRLGVNRLVLANYFVCCSLIATSYDMFLAGGLFSVHVIWLAIVPIIAVILGNRRTGYVWLGIIIVTLFMFGGLELSGYNFYNELHAPYNTYLQVSGMLGFATIIFLIANILESAYQRSMEELNKRNVQIEREKKRSDDLLLNILPKEVADELKETGTYEPRQFQNVSVVFADIINFTKISEQLGPKRLVEELNYIFSEFDKIMDENGLEKIKTIGDAYLAVSGLPDEVPDHAVKAIRASIDLQKFMHKYMLSRSSQQAPFFEMRLGINSGPVVGGIVGKNKFAYDIWGDTVNKAARLEQHSTAGKINISGHTFELVKKEFKCNYRGQIETKNKDLIDMYFVEFQESSLQTQAQN